MPPGTISGAEDPDDRLRAERPPGGYRRGPDRSPVASETTAPATVETLGFLLFVLAVGFLLLAFASRPLQELVGRLLGVFGLPFAAPSAYPGIPWSQVIRSSPQAFLASIVSSQLLFLLLAVLGALLLGGSLPKRLGFVRPRGGWRVLGLAVVLEVLVFALGIALVSAFIPSGYEAPKRNLELITMLRNAPLPLWIALTLAMSVLPGLCEESLFRGLIQRQLLVNWKVWTAIAVTGVIFTFLHTPLVRSLMLLPGCLWLGYVAWRCGSILPGIALHAGTNAGVQILIRVSPLDDSTAWDPAGWERLLYGGIALASAALAAGLLVLLHRWTKVPSPTPA